MPACEKRAALLTHLREACKRGPSACVVEGLAVLELEGDGRREQADALFERACKSGFASGCFQRAELHYEWEPRAEHDPIAERAYLRACQLGSAEGCCAVIALFEAKGNRRAAAHVARQQHAGFGCGSGRTAQ